MRSDRDTEIQRSRSADVVAEPVFTDVSAERGLRFDHFNGMVGERYLPEIMGPGAALFDADQDGDLDLYLVQGRVLGPKDRFDQSVQLTRDTASTHSDRLLLNELDASEQGGQRFVDVTEAAGIHSTGYGMGVAVGDVNRDGLPDLYVTNLGANRLLLNQSTVNSPRFVDVTEDAGVGDPGWAVSAAFVDIDNDGWLDLYVGNYLEFSAADHRQCTTPNGAQDYCGPRAFRPTQNRLFRNLGSGDARFEPAPMDGVVRAESGGALGVLAIDVDHNGWPDLYVANDERPNLLWMNQGDGVLTNEAMLAGAAVNGLGAIEASMGVDAGDVDNDGDLDLIVAHLKGETNTLYLNDGSGLFEDQTAQFGLGAPSLEGTGFGIRFLDYDNDGWLDVLVVNGAVRTVAELVALGDSYPLHQPNQLYRNRGDGQFEEVTDHAGSVFTLSEVTRGAPVGDIDNDGDLDVVLTNNNGPARLLLNLVGNRNGWLGLRMLDRFGSDAIGAEVTLHLGADMKRFAYVHTDGGYASARDPRVLFGLGPAPPDRIKRVTVVWPDGGTQTWTDLAVGQYHDLVQEGDG